MDSVLKDMGLQLNILDLPILNNNELFNQQINNNNNLNNVNSTINDNAEKKWTLPNSNNNKSIFLLTLDDMINQIVGCVEVNKNKYAINNNYYLTKNPENNCIILFN